MLILKDYLGNITISIKNKKALIQKNAFSFLSKSDLKQLRILIDIIYQKII